MARLDIPQRELMVLRAITVLEDTAFEALLNAFRKIDPEVGFIDFAPIFEKEVGSAVDAAFVRPFLRTTASLYRLIDGDEFTPEQLASNLKETIEFEKPSIFRDDMDKLDGLSKRVVSLLTTGSFINVLFKAGNVLTEQERVFRSIRIMSDIRPVFSTTNPEEVKAGIVVHSLNIHFSQDRQHKDFYVALTTPDLMELQEAVNRAVKKAEKLKTLIPKMDIRVIEERQTK